jgi:hypothetical protein
LKGNILLTDKKIKNDCRCAITERCQSERSGRSQEDILKTSESVFVVHNDSSVVTVRGRHYEITFDVVSGKISKVKVFDGIKWNDILADGQTVGDNWTLPVVHFKVIDQTEEQMTFSVIRESKSWRLKTEYEVFKRGYIVCTFVAEAIVDRAESQGLTVGISLDERIFAGNYRIRNTDNDPDMRQSIRGVALDFSCDDRPVTNSVDFLLESVMRDMNNRACRRIFEECKSHRFMGWKLSTGWAYPFPKGFKYENRWCLSLTGFNNGPNKVRGQRIYHFYGWEPVSPPDELLTEMAEYGCSILIMHTPFHNLSGSRPIDKEGLRRVVEFAHKLGIKVLPYCTPYLISHCDPSYKELDKYRTDTLNVWVNDANSQVSMFNPSTRWDADELCLRCEKAYQYMLNSIKTCNKEFGFDGLYVDFCWPAQGLCNNPDHAHEPGLFNYYDFLRLIRDWRKIVGCDGIMIGHGGGFLVGNDVVEEFDACLTGEAQKELDPVTIGQQYGTAPTLWPIQRRKRDIFRSDWTIEQLIKQGMTPHCGLGAMGTATIATLDPAHHVQLIALWQMWRAFPVHCAKFYNYLTESVISLSNDEVFYSMCVTDEGHVLLILVNAGGPGLESVPGIGVEVRIDLKKLSLPDEMNSWRMMGNTYETFRIRQTEKIENGKITVPLLDLHEFVGIVLSPDQPPEELVKLVEHLNERGKRLAKIYESKQIRLAEFDKALEQWSKLPVAATKIRYDEFMRGRTAE